MRVTNSMMLRTTLRDLNQSMSRLQATQTKLTSGREMPTASANPTKAADAMRLRQQLNRANQRESALDDAQGWLETADSTMTSALETINRAKEVAVRAANTGSIGDPAARAAMALEIKSIRAEMLAVANTKYGTRSVFGGTEPGPAYSAAAGYLGNNASVLRDVAPQTTMIVNVTGPQIFGTASGAVGGTPVGDMFEVLDRLAVAIESGTSADVATEHTNLDAAMATMGSATVIIGTRGASIEQLRARSTDDKLSLTSRLNDVESVDVVESLLSAKAQENAYQAALQVAAKIMPLSLLDYLR
jgi:flagellar hook-associated protein 3 FlgL